MLNQLVGTGTYENQKTAASRQDCDERTQTMNMATVLPKMELKKSSAMLPDTMKKSQTNRYSRQLLSSSAYCRLRKRLSNGYCTIHHNHHHHQSSSSSSSSKQLAMAPLKKNRCSAAPYKQYSTYNVG